MGEWYYIGHYGQLGPLTRDQISELIDGDVIGYDTYVWRIGMSEWLAAGKVPDLTPIFQASPTASTPPPPPSALPWAEPLTRASSKPTKTSYGRVYADYDRSLSVLKSDRSRTWAGVLQMLVPGVGRMYLGYTAYGVLQLFFALCGVGWLWSVVEGIYILTGGVKYDGYGRRLGE